jgi:hypothetical protein
MIFKKLEVEESK